MCRETMLMTSVHADKCGHLLMLQHADGARGAAALSTDTGGDGCGSAGSC
jgi:hypothetical protein